MAMKIYTAAEAAASIGCDIGTISRKCVKHGIGIKSGRQWVLTDSDVSKLRGVIREKPGNPKFKTGNYFGGYRKRPKKSRK